MAKKPVVVVPEKKMLSVKVDSIATSELERSAKDIALLMTGFIKSYGESVYLDYNDYTDVFGIAGTYHYDVMVIREETDEEYSARVKEDAFQIEHKNLLDKKEYLRLKALYE